MAEAPWQREYDLAAGTARKIAQLASRSYLDAEGVKLTDPPIL